MYQELKNNQAQFFSALAAPEIPPAQMWSPVGLCFQAIEANEQYQSMVLWDFVLSKVDRANLAETDLMAGHTRMFDINAHGRIVDVHNAGLQQTTGTFGQMDLEFAILLRGQSNPNGTSKRWEDFGNNGMRTKLFYNTTRFPAVMRYTEDVRGEKVGRAFPLAYRVVYSSFPPDVALPHKATWMKMNLRPDPITKNAVSVYVDTTLIGDNNCALAIMSSLENSFPVDGSYLCFFPDVLGRFYADQGSPFADPRAHKISGSSLGMAVFAAVSGWSNIMYTGYIPYIVPGYKMQGGQDYAQEARSKFSKTNPTYLTAPRSENIASGYSVSSKSIVKVVSQLNFVDSVQDMPLKIAFAESNGIPLVFPSSTVMGDSIHAFIDRSDNRDWLNEVLGMVPRFYTMAMAQDGKPAVYTLGNNNNRFTYTLYTGSTVTEFMMLSYISAYAKFETKGMPENTTQHVAAQHYQAGLIKNKLTMGKQMSERMDEYRKEVTEIKDKYAKDPPQWIAQTKALHAKNKATRVAKKKIKKEKSENHSLKRKEIRDTIKTAEENYKAEYQQAKIELGPKPTAKERSEFSKKWKNPASVRKRLNSAVLKSVWGEIPIKVYTATDAQKAESQRTGFVNKALAHGLDDNTIIAAVNAKYMNIPPIPAGTKMKDWSEEKANRQFERPTYSSQHLPYQGKTKQQQQQANQQQPQQQQANQQQPQAQQNAHQQGAAWAPGVNINPFNQAPSAPTTRAPSAAPLNGRQRRPYIAPEDDAGTVKERMLPHGRKTDRSEDNKSQRGVQFTRQQVEDEDVTGALPNAYLRSGTRRSGAGPYVAPESIDKDDNADYTQLD